MLSTIPTIFSPVVDIIRGGSESVVFVFKEKGGGLLNFLGVVAADFETLHFLLETDNFGD